MRHIKLLFIILSVAAVLYLYKLGMNPPGLFADEASTGYNIYTLLKTGRDEYGKFLPFGFRQLGSFTPPLYIYLSVPLVAILGLSEFSTRILSVICGLSIITMVFYLLNEFQICKSKTSLFFTTLFFAITPWLIFFSRMGYEQNLAFTLFTLSIILITKSLKNSKFLALAIPIMSLTTYADFPQRFLMPIIFVVFALAFRKVFKIRKNLKLVAIGIIIAAVIQIPNIYLGTTKSFYTKSEHFYSDVVASQAKKIDHYLPHPISVSLAFTREFLSQYINYFSPRSLFFNGDPDLQRSIPKLSVFYPWMIVFYFIGLYVLYKTKSGNTKKILVLLLFVTPLTGALTHQPFHIQRTLAFLLPLTLIMGLGIDLVCKKLGKKLSIISFSILFLVSLIFFWRSYFILLPQERASTWGFEWKLLAQFIQNHPEDRFVIHQSVNQKPEEIAYFQLAFYMKTEPQVIQASVNPETLQNYYNDINFSPFRKFLNIETRPIDWGEAVNKDEILIGDTVSISDLEVSLHNLTEVFVIKDPNNKIILRGFQTNPAEADKN